jgi:uncharacterized membrane protein
MSTLEKHVDVGVPIDKAWDSLHHVENYSRFVDGVGDARADAKGRAHLSIEAGDHTRELDADYHDHAENRVLEWHTRGTPELTGSFSLLPIDKNHTRVQARLEYDPDAVRDTFGGPRGFAQANAVERVVGNDLEHFKKYVEQGR